jgi:hypothetical protein
MNAVRLKRGTPKFSESNAKSDLDWKILFASEMPGRKTSPYFVYVYIHVYVGGHQDVMSR